MHVISGTEQNDAKLRAFSSGGGEVRGHRRNVGFQAVSGPITLYPRLVHWRPSLIGSKASLDESNMQAGLCLPALIPYEASASQFLLIFAPFGTGH